MYVCMYVFIVCNYVCMATCSRSMARFNTRYMSEPVPGCHHHYQEQQLTRCYSNTKKIKIDAVQPKSSRAYVKQKSTLVGGQ